MVAYIMEKIYLQEYPGLACWGEPLGTLNKHDSYSLGPCAVLCGMYVAVLSGTPRLWRQHRSLAASHQPPAHSCKLGIKINSMGIWGMDWWVCVCVCVCVCIRARLCASSATNAQKGQRRRQWCTSRLEWGEGGGHRVWIWVWLMPEAAKPGFVAMSVRAEEIDFILT